MPDQLAPVAEAGVVVRKVDLDDRLAADVDWKQKKWSQALAGGGCYSDSGWK